MIFTTKAEYGVRLLVELGRQHVGGDAPTPVSLKAIAEAEALPLAYLERIVALLKKAGIVEATRGAHGGYKLTREPAEIHMDEVVLALEGAVTPMTCFVAEDGTAGGHGRVVCNHEADSGHGCATKLLWTRVQGGVVKALADTTLAELVTFSNRSTTTVTTAPIPAPDRAAVA
jgi:Rrf2 family protein